MLNKNEIDQYILKYFIRKYILAAKMLLTDLSPKIDISIPMVTI